MDTWRVSKRRQRSKTGSRTKLHPPYLNLFANAANRPLETLLEGSNTRLRSKIRKLNEELARLSLAPQIAGVFSVSSSQSVTSDRLDGDCGFVMAVEPELVDPNDYWDFNQSNCPRQIDSLGINTLGDRVTRCFLVRLELHIDALREYLVNCQDQTFGNKTAKIAQAKSAAAEIRETCLERLNGFDEASIVLTQVYAGFARFADPHWIRDSSTVVQLKETLLAESILEPIVDPDALDRVVWALSTVSKKLEELPDPEVIVEYAASRFELVVDLSAKTFIWKGDQFLSNLSPSSWELFSVLIEARKHWNRPVEAFDVDGKNGSYGKLKVTKQRLVEALHVQFPDLANSIIPVDKSYALSIDRSQIELFTRKVTEQIYRLCGQTKTIPVSVDVRSTRT